MVINQVGKINVYDNVSIRINNDKNVNIVDEIVALKSEGKSIKPFSVNCYKAYDNKDSLKNNVKEINSLIKNISNVISDKKAEQMFLNGFDLDDVNINKINEFIKNADIDGINNVNKKLKSTDSFMNALNKHNLPFTKSNLSKLKRGYNIYSSLKSAGEDERISFLSNGYKKGDFSIKSVESSLKLNGFISERKTVDIDDEKIGGHLKLIGLNSDENSMRIAKKLMEVDVPVNRQNVLFASGENSMLNDEKTLSEMAEKMANMENELSTQAIEIEDEQQNATDSEVIEDVENIEEVDIKKAILENKFKNLKQIVDIKNKRIAKKLEQKLDDELTTSQLNDEIKLKRQVEEIRLKLTVKNIGKLKKLGVKVITDDISKVVEELRKIEEQTISNVLNISGEVATDEEISSIYDDSLVVQKLANIRGSIDFSQNINTASVSKKIDLNSYILTEIRSDLGDSVTKTFDGIEGRLESLNMDVTDSNILACKSLVRSGLDISKENILKVSLVGEQIDFLAKNLTPNTLLKINRAGINIKTLPLAEVVSITKLYAHGGVEHKLARLIANTKVDDSSYDEIMSTYKAIYKGLKKDSVALSNLIKSGADINLKNLKIFSGYKGYSENINKIIDESFGMLENSGELTSKKADESVFEVQKLLVNLRLAKVVSAITKENINTILKGSHRENLPFDELVAVLEEDINKDKYFDSKNGSLIKKMIEQKIPLTFSNIDKASKISKNNFQLIDDIREALSQMSSESEKQQLVYNIKKVLFEKPYDKKDLTKKLSEIKESIDDDEFIAKSKIESAVKIAKFADEFDELFFQLPYYAGEDLKQLNIFSKNRVVKEDEDIDVVLNLKTNNLGDKKVKLNIYENKVTLFVDVNDEVEKEIFSRFADEFEKSIKDDGFYFGGLVFKGVDSKPEEALEGKDIDDISSIISFKV